MTELGKSRGLSCFFKYGISLFVICSLLLAVSVLVNLEDKLLFSGQFDPWYLMQALVVQGLATGVIVLQWHHNLVLNGIKTIKLRESCALVGINALGKYVPGKVLGAVVRVVSVARKTGQSKAVVVASFQEQVAMVHSGFVVVALLYTWNNLTLFLLAFTLALLSLFLIPHFNPFIGYLIKVIGKRVDVGENYHLEGGVKNYAVIFFYLLVVWLLSALTLYFCVLVFSVGSLDYWFVLKITTLAYTAGFLAVFSPGGLGVRDGVIIAFLIPLMGVELAISISALHRLITIAFDVALGCYTFSFNRYAVNN